jgi:hypothetical protein
LQVWNALLPRSAANFSYSPRTAAEVAAVAKFAHKRGLVRHSMHHEAAPVHSQY